MRRKTLGLALGSGSFRGLAHIGVIKAFEKNNIPIDYLSGSSIGAVIGSLYASGMTVDEMENLAIEFAKKLPFTLDVDPWQVFVIALKAILKRTRVLPSRWLKISKGLIKGTDIYHYLEGIIGKKRFDQLEKPFVVMSTDLDTGEGIAFATSKLPIRSKSLEDMKYYYNEIVVDAVMASISIPGLFEPVLYDQRHLVDGGVKNSVPVDVLTLFEPQVIVGIDLGFNSQTEEEIIDPVAAVVQTIDIMGQEISSLNLQKYADIVIRPKLRDIDLNDLTTVTEAIEVGEKIGLKVIPKIKNLLGI